MLLFINCNANNRHYTQNYYTIGDNLIYSRLVEKRLGMKAETFKASHGVACKWSTARFIGGHRYVTLRDRRKKK